MKFQRLVIFPFPRTILFSMDAKSKTVKISFWLQVKWDSKRIKFVLHCGKRVFSAITLRKAELGIHVNVHVEYVIKAVLSVTSWIGLIEEEVIVHFSGFLRIVIIFNLLFWMFISFHFIVIFLECHECQRNSDCPNPLECYYSFALSETGCCYSGKYLDDIDIMWIIYFDNSEFIKNTFIFIVLFILNRTTIMLVERWTPTRWMYLMIQNSN